MQHRLLADLDRSLRAPGELDALRLAERAFSAARDVVEIVDDGPDRMALLVAFDILGARLDRRLEHRFVAAGRAG